MFCRNVGGVDRALRLVLGAVLLAVGLVLLAEGRAFATAVTISGGFVLASGVLGFCPPYLLLGISTARGEAPCAPASERTER